MLLTFFRNGLQPSFIRARTPVLPPRCDCYASPLNISPQARNRRSTQRSVALLIKLYADMVRRMAEAETISVGPLTIRFLVENDALSMFECHVPAGGRVPAPHSHDAFEETIYGLDGTTFFTVGGERHTLARGEAVLVPRGVVHSFEVGDEGAAFLAVATPGVFGSAYFRELGDVIAAAAGPLDPQDIMSVMRRHGLTPAPG